MLLLQLLHSLFSSSHSIVHIQFFNSSVDPRNVRNGDKFVSLRKYSISYEFKGWEKDGREGGGRLIRRELSLDNAQWGIKLLI